MKPRPVFGDGIGYGRVVSVVPIEISELEFQLICLTRKVEQANHMVMEFHHFLLSKPDVFENPEKYEGWYPYQQYKKHCDIRDAAMKKVDEVEAQMLEARMIRKSVVTIEITEDQSDIAVE